MDRNRRRIYKRAGLVCAAVVAVIYCYGSIVASLSRASDRDIKLSCRLPLSASTLNCTTEDTCTIIYTVPNCLPSTARSKNRVVSTESNCMESICRIIMVGCRPNC